MAIQDDTDQGAEKIDGVRHGTLGVPLARRREPTDKDLSDPRFDVIWELIKRVDVDFRNGLFSGATGNDVCAVLDELDGLPPSTDQGAAVELQQADDKFIDQLQATESLIERTAEALGYDQNGLTFRERQLGRALITAALAQGRAETQEWQPIETAPKDGTTVLICYAAWAGPRVVRGRYYGADAPYYFERNMWRCDIGYVNPTHWQPLPPPPPLVVGEREEPQKTDGAALLPVDPSAAVKTETLPTLLEAKEALLAEVWVQGRAGNIAAMIDHVAAAAVREAGARVSVDNDATT